MMKVINLQQSNEKQIIREAIQVFKNSGLIVYPTETCYGLGVDVTNKKAVDKVIEFKGLARKKPILIAVSDRKIAAEYVKINETAANLYCQFLPGPVAVVSKSKHNTDRRLESTNQTLGIRIPDYPLILKIIKAFGKPITSTSANQTGKKPPYSLTDFTKYTSLTKQSMIDLFLDAGKLPTRSPSTVVDTTLNEPAILRQGEIVIPDLINQTFISNSEKETQLIAQSIFSSHVLRLTSHPLIFALQGELGSGKTQFAKGLGQALKIKEIINSPTFNIIKEYPIDNGIFYHLDTWRLEKGDELIDLGLEKMLQPGNIIAVEWLQKIKLLLENISNQKQAKIVWISIETLSPTERKIKYRI